MFFKNLPVISFGVPYTSLLLITMYFLVVTGTFNAQAQEETSKDSIVENSQQQENPISLFIDCNNCDKAFIRQELNYVNFARDPHLAQIHLFITDISTASGGRQFTISFIGKEEFDGKENTLTYTSGQVNTQQEERIGLTSIIELGLLPYLAQTSLAQNIKIEVSRQPVKEIEEEEDPWNNWIFQIYGGLNFSEESSQSSLDIRYGLYADYVTETWRIRLRPFFNYNQRDYVRDEEKIRSVLNRDGFEGRVVRSISDHWSLGLFTNVDVNTFENIDFGYRVAPAIEYSLLPYEKALRKEYTVAYSIGYINRQYIEETIYNEIEEALYNQSLELGVRVLEPWGSVRTSVAGSNFLHDVSKYRVSFKGRFAYRVFKGFSVDISSRIEYLQDQLSLPKGDVSLEDVLLQQRQLATNYGISLSLGLSYNFGSIYNNVVNTRL